MDGVIFEKFIGSIKNLKSKNFDDLFKIYQQILLITSGDFNKTISLLTELDRKYNMTSDKYGIGNFVDDLKKKGYITENDSIQEIAPSFEALKAYAERLDIKTDLSIELSDSGFCNAVPLRGSGNQRCDG